MQIQGLSRGQRAETLNLSTFSVHAFTYWQQPARLQLPPALVSYLVHWSSRRHRAGLLVRLLVRPVIYFPECRFLPVTAVLVIWLLSVSGSLALEDLGSYHACKVAAQVRKMIET